MVDAGFEWQVHNKNNPLVKDSKKTNYKTTDCKSFSAVLMYCMLNYRPE